jgi:hypothetical protein
MLDKLIEQEMEELDIREFHIPIGLRGAIESVIRRVALAYGAERAREERERCKKALCSYCQRDIPLVNGYHQIRDGLVPLGADYRVKMCPAALIHRLD